MHARGIYPGCRKLTNIQRLKSPWSPYPITVWKAFLLLANSKFNSCRSLHHVAGGCDKFEIGSVAIALIDTVNIDKHCEP